jgi:hypothetical protein
MVPLWERSNIILMSGETNYLRLPFRFSNKNLHHANFGIPVPKK